MARVPGWYPPSTAATSAGNVVRVNLVDPIGAARPPQFNFEQRVRWEHPAKELASGRVEFGYWNHTHGMWRYQIFRMDGPAMWAWEDELMTYPALEHPDGATTTPKFKHADEVRGYGPISLATGFRITGAYWSDGAKAWRYSLTRPGGVAVWAWERDLVPRVPPEPPYGVIHA